MYVYTCKLSFVDERRISMREFLLSLVCVGLMGGVCVAQAAPQTAAAAGLPSVPMIKVLAIGHMTATATTEVLLPVMKNEVPETVKLYLGGKIDQWYVRQDQRGVVFLMNVTSVEEAHALLEKLPLGQAKLMEFELIPLGPLSPLARLLGPAAAAPAAAGK
jgi:hypothetical protein